MVPIPNKPLEFFACGRQNEKLSYHINFNSKKVVQKIEADANHYYYGHACFGSNGSFLAATEFSETNGGQIVFRDVQNKFKVVKKIGVGPYKAHDIAFNQAQKEFLVVNAATNPSGISNLMRISEKGSIVSKAEVSSPFLEVSHVCRFGEQGVFISYLQRHKDPKKTIDTLCGVVENGKLSEIEVPKKIVEMHDFDGFSTLATDDGRYGFVTSRTGSGLTAVDLRAKKYIKTFDLRKARALAIDDEQKNLYVGCLTGNVYRIDLNSLTAKLLELKKPKELMFESHASGLDQLYG